MKLVIMAIASFLILGIVQAEAKLLKIVTRSWAWYLVVGVICGLSLGLINRWILRWKSEKSGEG